MKTLKTFNSFSLNENIEYEKRLSQPIIDILNTQIKNELESSQIYKGMSTWLDDKGWVISSKYYYTASQEEITHMDKIYDYLFEKNCKPIVPTIGQIKQDFKDIREVLEESLKHEIIVTKNWENIADLALKEKDNTTYNFSQWFINEQRSEEEKFRNLLFALDKEIPDWYLDENFEKLGKG
jgi:ferritin